MTQVEEIKVRAAVDKLDLRKRILMYQATKGKHRYTPEELKTKTLKQLQKIWDEIERGSGHA